MPPVQNMAMARGWRRCTRGRSTCSTQAGNSRKLLVLGSMAPAKLPIATS